MSLLLFAGLAVFFIVWATGWGGLHPVLALVLGALGYGLLAGMPGVEVVKSLNAGFGNIVGSIGIVILAGAMIGVFLERSGGALVLAGRIVGWIGAGRGPLAMTVLGYVVSIPVFCDSAFVLLSPINRAMARRAGGSVAAGAIALSLGLYATHTMVPPTPGPVAAAGLLGADVGLVILWGLLVSGVAAIGGWVFAVWAGGRVEVGEEAAASAPEAGRRPVRGRAWCGRYCRSLCRLC